jgi:hypothetical protein
VIGQLAAINPITHRRDHLTAALADPIEERMLHMVTADPLRTPTFTMFGDPDYFSYPPDRQDRLSSRPRLGTTATFSAKSPVHL